jgi:hypothetical protein
VKKETLPSSMQNLTRGASLTQYPEHCGYLQRSCASVTPSKLIFTFFGGQQPNVWHHVSVTWEP